MSLNNRILEDIKTAMKAKDATRLSVLRMVKANLMNKKIEKGAELTDEEIQQILSQVAIEIRRKKEEDKDQA